MSLELEFGVGVIGLCCIRKLQAIGAILPSRAAVFPPSQSRASLVVGAASLDVISHSPRQLWLEYFSV